MKIAEYVGNNIVIIEPHGRLTIETVHVFRKAIDTRIDGGWRRLILTCRTSPISIAPDSAR